MISFEQFQVLVESELVWTFLIFISVTVVIFGTHNWLRNKYIEKNNDTKLYGLLIKSTARYQEENQKRVDKLETEIEKYKQNYYKMLMKIDELSDKIKGLEEENNVLKKSHKELTEENRLLRNSITVMQHELKQKDEAIKELTRRQDGTEHRTT